MWTLSDAKRDALVDWIWAIAISPETKPAVAVKAFRALVEAAKLDLAERAVAAIEPAQVANDDDVIEGIIALVGAGEAGEDLAGDGRRPPVPRVARPLDDFPVELGPLATGGDGASRDAG